ncbi:MAG: hypothetical protein U5P10_17000 [Spirochaetia bacterium]|nr:hypothetical protein [Spirochaetia bacterium]
MLEDELFLHYDAAVSPETDRHLAAKFDKFEDQVMGAGVHERFHRLLESLSAKYLQEGRTE